MPPEYLTTGEFGRWTTEHRLQMDRLLTLAEKAAARDGELDKRVASLEANQERAGKLAARLSALVAAIVTAVTTGLIGLGLKTIGGK